MKSLLLVLFLWLLTSSNSIQNPIGKELVGRRILIEDIDQLHIQTSDGSFASYRAETEIEKGIWKVEKAENTNVGFRYLITKGPISYFIEFREGDQWSIVGDDSEF